MALEAYPSPYPTLLASKSTRQIKATTELDEGGSAGGGGAKETDPMLHTQYGSCRW